MTHIPAPPIFYITEAKLAIDINLSLYFYLLQYIPKMSNPTSWESEAPIVPPAPLRSPSPVVLQSSLSANHHMTVTLVPLCEAHIPLLYPRVAGPGNEHLWQYTTTGRYDNLEEFTEGMHTLLAEQCVAFTIFSTAISPLTSSTTTREGEQEIQGDGLSDRDRGFGVPVGITCLTHIEPKHRSIEIGHVLASSVVQRTTTMTEANYLLLSYCFDELGYRRVQWKTNNLNNASKNAALRMGFVAEGVFRKHMVIKGRNRDSAWFSLVDDEWPVVKAGFEGWLDKGNFLEGRQVKRMQDFRREVGGEDGE